MSGKNSSRRDPIPHMYHGVSDNNDNELGDNNDNEFSDNNDNDNDNDNPAATEPAADDVARVDNPALALLFNDLWWM